MPTMDITEKQLLAIRAVAYGCNTNRRLAGASFLENAGTDEEKSISFYEAIDVVYDLLETIK